MNDLKFAFRQLLKNPGFTAVAVLSLSLGIAANTTIFSFVNTLLLRPPPVLEPDRLWQVWQQNPKAGSAAERYLGLSYPGYVHLRDRNQSFVSLAAFDPETPFVSWNRDGVGQSIQCQFVSGNYFTVCGLSASLGGAFSPEEDRQPGADPVVIVSHAFWKNTLGRDPRVVGRILSVNGVSLTVIGVAPEGFTGLMTGLSPDLWAPYMMAPVVLHDPEWHTRTGAFSHFGIGRLKPGVSTARAEAELGGLLQQQEAAAPHPRGFSAAVFPATMVPAPFRGMVGAFTAVFMAAVLMVLLIACANAANLTLARAVSRRREMSVRASIGASRRRLMRQLLAESTLLAGLGGGIGLLLTYWAVPLLLRLTPPTLPIRPEVVLDARVLGFTVLVSALTALLFGFAPAWQGTKLDLASALKVDSPATGARRSRLAGALIIGQVAVCLVLLISGSLCLRSLFNAQNVKLGFKVENRVTAELNLKDYGYTDAEKSRFNTAFLDRVGALPGIESVAIADYLPLDSRYLSLDYRVEGQEASKDQPGHVIQTFDVGSDYFATMGTGLLRGREFARSDREGGALVAIINQAMADRFWPGQEAVGHRLFEGKPGTGDSYEIVGVVENGKYRTLGEAVRPVVYRSRFQQPRPRSTFVAHVRGDPQAALGAIREVTRELDPRLALARLDTLDHHLALALFPARATGLLFGVFGSVALLLAVSGLFGVIAYSVSQRTREIGIRMALGACRRDVVSMVLRQGLRLTLAGVAAGLAIALAVTRLLRSLLLDVSPLDPFTFTAVPLLLITITLLACLFPARRASQVDPMVALRTE
ncbi:MAG TPA: ABC transporter permease [Candidatus Limnocylindria bacterium]|nr:ABC transporter permease [Candidatus Limnocylindria bacterium]